MPRPLPLVPGPVVEGWANAEVRAYFEDSYRLGTPPPSGLLLQAHSPAVLLRWCRLWWGMFHLGRADHALKELLRMLLARLSACNA